MTTRTHDNLEHTHFAHKARIGNAARTGPRLGRLAAMTLILAGLAGPAAVQAQMQPYGGMSPYAAAGTDTALQQLTAARNELHAADAALKALVDRYQRKLAAENPDWAGCRKEAEDAAQVRDKAQNAVLASLKSDAGYAADQEALTNAEGRMQQFRDAHAEYSRDYRQADDQAYTIRNRLRDQERQALQQSADMQAAEARLQKARDRMQEYWDGYAADVLSRNPSWVAAVRRQQEAAAAAKQAEATFVSERRMTAGTGQRGYGSGGSYGSRSGSHSSSRSGSSSHSGGGSRSNRSNY